MSRFLKGYVFSPREMSEMAIPQLEAALINTKSIMFAIQGEHRALMRKLQEQACYIQREISTRECFKISITKEKVNGIS